MENIESFAREIINGCWFWLNILITFVFVRFLVMETSSTKAINPRHILKSLREAVSMKNPLVSACLGLILYHFGSAVTRGWTWAALVLQGEASRFSPFNQWFYLNASVLIGGPLAILGCIMILRTFGPVKYSQWLPWLTIFLAIMIPIFAAVFI